MRLLHYSATYASPRVIFLFIYLRACLSHGAYTRLFYLFYWIYFRPSFVGLTVVLSRFHFAFHFFSETLRHSLLLLLSTALESQYKIYILNFTPNALSYKLESGRVCFKSSQVNVFLCARQQVSELQLCKHLLELSGQSRNKTKCASDPRLSDWVETILLSFSFYL